MDAMGNDVFNLDSYTIVLDLQVNKNHLGQLLNTLKSYTLVLAES